MSLSLRSLQPPFVSLQAQRRPHQLVADVAVLSDASGDLQQWKVLVRPDGPPDVIVSQPLTSLAAARKMTRALNTAWESSGSLQQTLEAVRSAYHGDARAVLASLGHPAVDFELATVLSRPDVEVEWNDSARTIYVQIPLQSRLPDPWSRRALMLHAALIVPGSPDQSLTGRLRLAVPADTPEPLATAAAGTLPTWSSGMCLEEAVAGVEQKLAALVTAGTRDRDALLQALVEALGRPLEYAPSPPTASFLRGSAVLRIQLPPGFPALAPRLRLMSTRYTDAEGNMLAVDLAWPSARDAAPAAAARAVRVAADNALSRVGASAAAAARVSAWGSAPR